MPKVASTVIRERRLFLGFTEIELANVMGMSVADYRLVETGDRELDLSALHNLRTILHLSLDEILGKVSPAQPLSPSMARLAAGLPDEDRVTLENFAAVLRNKPSSSRPRPSVPARHDVPTITLGRFTLPVLDGVDAFMTWAPRRDFPRKRFVLVGSSRFRIHFSRLGARLEKEGHLAIAMSFFSHSDGISVSAEERAVLAEVDRDRLRLADGVIVVAPRMRWCKKCGDWIEPKHLDRAPPAGHHPHDGDGALDAYLPYVGADTVLEIDHALNEHIPVRVWVTDFYAEEG